MIILGRTSLTAQDRHRSLHKNRDINHYEHKSCICQCHTLNTTSFNTSTDLRQLENQIKASESRCRGEKILTTKLAKVVYRLCHKKYDVLPCSSQSFTVRCFRVKSGTILHHMSFQAFNAHLLIHKDYLLQFMPTSI